MVSPMTTDRASLPRYDDLPVRPEMPPGSSWGLWGDRDVDALPDSRLLALIEGGEDGRQALERGVHVAVREHVVGHRTVTRLPLRPCDAGLGLHDGSVRAAA